MRKRESKTVCSNNEEVSLAVEELRQAARCFRAINHRLRRTILQRLHRDGECTVMLLYQSLRLSQSLVSQHLAILRKAGLVTATRKGKHVVYAVNDEKLARLHLMAQSLLET